MKKWFFSLCTMVSLTAPWANAQTAPKGETGLAGVYSDAFHDRMTSSGEKYNKNEFTGAHKSLPYGTVVKVTLVDDPSKWVEVRINDRGPYEKGRIIDVSKAAAVKIGLDQKGYANVRLEITKKTTTTNDVVATTTTTTTTTVTNANNTTVTETKQPTTTTKTETKPATLSTTETKTTVTKPATTETKTTKPASTETKVATTETKTTKPATTETKTTAANTKTTTTTNVTKPTVAEVKPAKPEEAASMESGGLYKVQVLKMPNEGFGVQVAGLSDYNAVNQKVAELQKQWFKGAMVYVDELNNAPYYRVILGPFYTKDEAASYQESLKTKYKMKDAFVVDLKALSEKK